MGKIKNFNWSVSCISQINCDVNTVWKIISAKSNLELFHPFCKKNKVIKWSRENSVDQIEYLNGSIFQREFSKWEEKVGYDLFIRQIEKPQSFVQWRLKKNEQNCELEITVFPYLLNKGNKIIFWLPYHLVVKPILSNYLASVVNGLKFYAEKGFPTPKNHFGRHIWFS